MKLEGTVSEIADIFKEIQERPGQLFEMIRLDIYVCHGYFLKVFGNGVPQYFAAAIVSLTSSLAFSLLIMRRFSITRRCCWVRVNHARVRIHEH